MWLLENDRFHKKIGLSENTDYPSKSAIFILSATFPPTNEIFRNFYLEWHNRNVFRVNGRGHSKPDVPIFDSFQGQFKIKNPPFDLEFGISEITHFRISKFFD